MIVQIIFMPAWAPFILPNVTPQAASLGDRLQEFVGFRLFSSTIP